jgi:hypothetical protein
MSKLMLSKRIILAICVVILLAFSYFSRVVGFIFGVLALLTYIFIYRKSDKVSASEVFLVIFTVVVIGAGPTRLKYEITRWSDKFFNTSYKEVRVPTPWGALIVQVGGDAANLKEEKVNIIPRKNELEQLRTNEVETAALIASSLVRQKIENNLINNGDFNIPLMSKLSQWGHGFYSDKIKSMDPNIDFVWVNLLNADIGILVEKTDAGNALKVMHRSETMNHRVGIMEQRIKVMPGKYKISFKAKALDDFEQGGIWISTNDEWVDPCETNIRGPFEWQVFSKEIELNKTGTITLTVISQGKGTVFITDVSLARIERN